MATRGSGRLTPREEEIVALIAQGMDSRQIGRQLNIAYFTVRKHRANIHAKLRLGGAPQLTAYALAVAPGPTPPDHRSTMPGPP